MRRRFWLLMFACSVLLVDEGRASDEPNRAPIEKVYADSQGQIHIVSDGNDVVPKKEKDQRSCSSPKLAEDGRTAGWLVEYDNCCTSYPLPLMLVVYRGGRVIQRISPGQSIWDWQLLKAGKQVAFWIGPTHGEFTPHFELHDVKSGRLLAEWDGHVQEKHPSWVAGLKE